MTQTSNCGNTKEISGTKVCNPDLSISKKVYGDDTRNTDGTYYIGETISKIARGETLVYGLEIKNNGEGKAKNVIVTDVLTGQNQNLLTFLDSESKCTFDYPSKKLTCTIDNMDSEGVENIKFRAKVAQTAMNGKVIRNTVKVTYANKVKQASVDVLVSSVVNCNEYCSSDSECLTGLACDVFTNKCRRPSCSQSSTCICPTPTATATIRPTATPTEEIVDFPESSQTTPNIVTTTPVMVAEEAAPTAAYLPETGILDMQQTTIFGGGIILAILGLFLAL